MGKRVRHIASNFAQLLTVIDAQVDLIADLDPEVTVRAHLHGEVVSAGPLTRHQIQGCQLLISVVIAGVQAPRPPFVGGIKPPLKCAGHATLRFGHPLDVFYGHQVVVIDRGTDRQLDGGGNRPAPGIGNGLGEQLLGAKDNADGQGAHGHNKHYLQGAGLVVPEIAPDFVVDYTHVSPAPGAMLINSLDGT